MVRREGGGATNKEGQQKAMKQHTESTLSSRKGNGEGRRERGRRVVGGI